MEVSPIQIHKSSSRQAPIAVVAAAVGMVFAVASPLEARTWKFTGVSKTLEAEYVGMNNGWVVLKDGSGKSFEFALENFIADDQQFLRSLANAEKQKPAARELGKPHADRRDYTVKTVETLSNQVITLTGGSELHITANNDPIPGCSFIFKSPDAWLFLDHVPPSVVGSKLLGRMRIDAEKADTTTNVRVVQYGAGTVVIPHAPDFPAMTLFNGKSLTGTPLPLNSYVKYDSAKLSGLKGPAVSFVLKRGYTATLAQNENGTGVSRNYVAQDHDVVVNEMPTGLGGGVRFVRIFPWRWVEKKGIAGGIWQNLNVGWFYDWNIGANSTPDLEYVAIRQNRNWPSLDQDWKKKGINHLLGYNEPDKKDQSNLTVDEAIASWPTLLATGQRLGAPAPSDGGLSWLYEFMDRANATGLRVDFVPVHYYRAVNDPKDEKGAAEQFRQFLKGVHDRVKRPLWVTEWNNGANWTKAPDPSESQQKEAIAEMIEMLDETPYVERYALYNWVEDARQLVRKDGSLTPAGVVYRDKQSPLSYTQPK